MNLSRGTVRAPYDGVVTALHTEIGSYLKEGGAVLALVNDRKLEIEADVPAARIAGLAPGAEVAVLLPDGTKHRARVRAVVPDENAMTRTRLVRFTPEFGADGGAAGRECGGDGGAAGWRRGAGAHGPQGRDRAPGAASARVCREGRQGGPAPGAPRPRLGNALRGSGRAGGGRFRHRARQ